MQVAVWPQQESAKLFIATDVLSLTVEVIPPPEQWEDFTHSSYSAFSSAAQYTHLDVIVDEVYVSPLAHGVLGCTQNHHSRRDGGQYLSSVESDNSYRHESLQLRENVFEGELEEYAVSSLLASDFKYSSFVAATDMRRRHTGINSLN